MIMRVRTFAKNYYRGFSNIKPKYKDKKYITGLYNLHAEINTIHALDIKLKQKFNKTIKWEVH